jgi:hypothetical protein
MKKEKLNKDGYPDRKPDKETESFRMWKSDKKYDYLEEMKDCPKINYEGIEITIGGFDVIYDKPITEPDKKVMLAIKFKHDKQDILYYISDEADEKHKEILNKLKFMALCMGYVTTDMKNTLKGMKMEMDIINNKKKEKNKKLK